MHPPGLDIQPLIADARTRHTMTEAARRGVAGDLRQRGRTRRRTERPSGPQKPAGPADRGRGPVGVKPHPQIIIQRKFAERIQDLQTIVQQRVGKRIRNLRKKRGLTQEKLAQLCGKNALKLSKIERGEVNLAISTIVHLAKALDITIARLFRGIS